MVCGTMATSSVHRVWYSLTRVQQHDTTHVVDMTPSHEHPTLIHTRVGTAFFSTALGATYILGQSEAGTK